MLCFYLFYFILEKPGKSKFAPSIGGRKAQTPQANSTGNNSSATTEATYPADISTTLKEESDQIIVNNSLLNGSVNSESLKQSKEGEESLNSAPLTVGKKIESIQSRRLAASTTSATTKLSSNSFASVQLPSGPKDAASIATSSSLNSAEKRTMAYFLKDSGEGREMPNSNNNAGSTSNNGNDGSLSPSKTRRIVNLRNIKAPTRSASTATALAPQVRVVDGAIVYDEKFSAALAIPTSSATADVEQELEYVDEDDENGKHLTSATYATRGKGSNRWNSEETGLFYEALSMCGTDFSMIQTLFSHRTRAQIKGKYKLEERANPAKIDSALRNRKPFDSEFSTRVKEAAKK